MTPEAIAGLKEVLLQAVIRAERRRAGVVTDAAADVRAVEIAKRWDEKAAEARK